MNTKKGLPKRRYTLLAMGLKNAAIMLVFSFLDFAGVGGFLLVEVVVGGTRVRLLGCFVALAFAGLFSLSGESCGELGSGTVGIGATFRSLECENTALCL